MDGLLLIREINIESNKTAAIDFHFINAVIDHVDNSSMKLIEQRRVKLVWTE